MSFFSIAGYPVDVIKQYRPHYSSKTTDHPTEQGSEFTDNIQANPYEFTMDCVISNTPSGSIATDATRQGTSIVKDAWAALVAVHEARQPITVIAPDGTYTSMAMVDLARTMDAAAHGGLLFTVSFKKIVVVTVKRVTVRSALPVGSGTKPLGDKTPVVVGEFQTVYYVIRVATDRDTRAALTKLYGLPLSSTDADQVNHDFFKVDPKKKPPDGMLTPEGHYHPMASGANAVGISGHQYGVEGVDHTAPHFDPSDSSYKYPDGSRVTQNTNAGDWNRTTGKVPAKVK